MRLRDADIRAKIETARPEKFRTNFGRPIFLKGPFTTPTIICIIFFGNLCTKELLFDNNGGSQYDVIPSKMAPPGNSNIKMTRHLFPIFRKLWSFFPIYFNESSVYTKFPSVKGNLVPAVEVSFKYGFK